MAEPFIHAENLAFTYKGSGGADDIPALNGITLDIQKGEFVAILGHNGSGKSTFAKLLNLILEPTGGTLSVAGFDLSKGDLSEDDLIALRRRVGMVFQNPDNQLVATIVEDDVAFGPENLGVPMPELRERVDEALAAVGMSEFSQREPHHLSGGQKQRVAIAGILAMKPECVVFDEATAMLDPVGRKEVLDTIRRLNREDGMTVIHITHYMNEAALADRIVVLNDGAILMQGTPDEVFSRRNELRAVGLEVPQCAELIHRLREAGIPVSGQSVSSLEGCAEQILKCFAKEGRDNG